MKKVKERTEVLLNMVGPHNAMFREPFNKVPNACSNGDFGTTKNAKMYFSMAEPFVDKNAFASKDVKLHSFS